MLKDNQVGETNFYTNNGNGVPLNNYNYMASMPACTATNFAPRASTRWPSTATASSTCRTASIVAPIWQLPFGKDRRWCAKSSVGNLLAGGWTASAVVNLQSGFPIGLAQSDNTLFAGANRPNLTGVGFETTGELRGSARVGRPSDRDVDQPGGGHAGASGHLRQRASSHHRRPDAADHQHRPVGVEEHSGWAAASRRRSSSRSINLFNRVQTNSIGATAGSSTFGQIT